MWRAIGVHYSFKVWPPPDSHTLANLQQNVTKKTQLNPHNNVSLHVPCQHENQAGQYNSFLMMEKEQLGYHWNQEHSFFGESGIQFLLLDGEQQRKTRTKNINKKLISWNMVDAYFLRD